MAAEDPTLLARFWARVDKTGDCWLWLGPRDRKGYGMVCVRNRSWRAARFAWTVTRGPIPPGLFVCHHCDNPPCVRPDHLFVGTAGDNARDCVAKRRHNLQLNPPPRLKGSASPNAKVTWEKVRLIRKLRAEGKTYDWLAAEFGIGPTQVTNICQRICWRDDPEEA